MNNILNFSQKLVYVRDLSSNCDTKLLNQVFENLTFRDNIENKISNEMNFFDRDLFIDTKLFIENECKTYLNKYHGLEQFYTDLVITSSWGNITEPSQGHHEHMHPFSIVSGVIFLDDTVDNLNLHIEAYQPEIPYFIPKGKSFISLKSMLPEMGINPADHKNLQNHLVLFLSNSHHFVDKSSPSSPVRRSVSFNTFWKGMTGVKSEALARQVF